MRRYENRILLPMPVSISSAWLRGKRRTSCICCLSGRCRSEFRTISHRVKSNVGFESARSFQNSLGVNSRSDMRMRRLTRGSLSSFSIVTLNGRSNRECTWPIHQPANGVEGINSNVPDILSGRITSKRTRVSRDCLIQSCNSAVTSLKSSIPKMFAGWPSRASTTLTGGVTTWLYKMLCGA